MILREEYEEREARLLAPYAIKSRDSRGRTFLEKEHDFRPIFQRDKERIIFSTAFRRLEYKTQVFIFHEGDHYRTRLTHTLEVAQISRSVARSLELNEDLVEAISLAHDLGHGPFGHATEATLNELMVEQGGFEHNRQSLRVVEELEESYPDFRGLNLSWEVKEGIQKHSSPFDQKEGQSSVPSSLEAMVVDIADEITYDSHDIDDGLRASFFIPSDLNSLSLWKEIVDRINIEYPGIKDFLRPRLAIKLLINEQVIDLVKQTEKNISENHVNTLEDFRRSGKRIVGFSNRMQTQKKELKKYLNENVYNNYRVVRMSDKARRIISRIFQLYLQKPSLLPPNVLERSQREGLERAICDYIAGMTDRYVLDEYRKLFEPYERV